MQPAVEMQDERMDRADAERRMFEEEYSMRSAGMNDEASRFAQGRSLPPLRIAIARRESYNEP